MHDLALAESAEPRTYSRVQIVNLRLKSHFEPGLDRVDLETQEANVPIMVNERAFKR